MNAYVTQLADVLEEEISVGEELERNLAAQKKALIGWDMAGLLEQIATREPWLRALGALEIKRKEILQGTELSHNAATLRQLLAPLPADAPEAQRLSHLRERGGEIFRRLDSDEHTLHGLMENLLGHIQEALRPLLRSAAPLYCETGAAEPIEHAREILPPHRERHIGAVDPVFAEPVAVQARGERVPHRPAHHRGEFHGHVPMMP